MAVVGQGNGALFADVGDIGAGLGRAWQHQISGGAGNRRRHEPRHHGAA